MWFSERGFTGFHKFHKFVQPEKSQTLAFTIPKSGDIIKWLHDCLPAWGRMAPQLWCTWVVQFHDYFGRCCVSLVAMFSLGFLEPSQLCSWRDTTGNPSILWTVGSWSDNHIPALFSQNCFCLQSLNVTTESNGFWPPSLDGMEHELVAWTFATFCGKLFLNCLVYNLHVESRF